MTRVGSVVRQSALASCSGLEARGTRSVCGENSFPRLNILWGWIYYRYMTLKPMRVNWSLWIFVKMIASIDVQKLSNYPPGVNISRHINSVTPCPAKIVSLCPPGLWIWEIIIGFWFYFLFKFCSTNTNPNLIICSKLTRQKIKI